MRCFHIARHLAAKFGTEVAVFVLDVFFAVDDSYLGVVLLFLLFLVSAIVIR
jgi:hypothetical protein